MYGFHSLLHTKEDLAKDIAVYYGMISMMDKYIGKILDKLRELELEENTLVIFTTDHGHFFGHHGLVAKGAFHYEGLIKIPFIARLPGQIPAGTSSDALLSLVDLAPTFLSFCRHSCSQNHDGLDQSQVLKEESLSAITYLWKIVTNPHPSTLRHMLMKGISSLSTAISPMESSST